MESYIHQKALAAENEYWWFVARREILVALIKKFVPPKSKVLDTGGGTGFIAELLQKSYDVTVVDQSEEAIKICNAKHLTAHRASHCQIPFPDQSFDAVICFDSLYHRDSQPVENSLSEMNRVTKPGGFLILAEPAYSWLSGRGGELDHTARRFTKNGLESLVLRQKMSIRQTGYFNTFLFPLIALARLWDRIALSIGIRRESRTDFETLPPFLNRIFRYIFQSEKKAVLAGGFPFGVSVYCVAQK